MQAKPRRHDAGFPVLIEPGVIQRLDRSIGKLIPWLREYHDWFETHLLQNGALLFRGFGLKTPKDFEAFVQATNAPLLSYIEGNSPRDHVTGNVYTSTTYPAEYAISLHNELSYAHSWPSKLFFFCCVAPDSGGETPIADCKRVLAQLDSRVRNIFVEKQVKYIQNMHGGYGLGKSWQRTFETNDRQSVEEYCRRGDVKYHWSQDGGLRTTQIRPAIREHPKTGDVTWFNQADQWHPSNLDEETRNALLKLSEEELPLNCVFGDGSPIDDSHLDHIREIMWAEAVANKWEQGDVLVIDNMLVAHGRMPYRGRRQILVAMT
jgi:alpha-ketoglutarate-dependent taurine dioxygenase